MEDRSSGSLCSLCEQFTTELQSFNFTKQDDYPAGWVKNARAKTNSYVVPWRDAFQHHLSYSALAESAISCALCNVLLEDLSSSEDVVGAGALQLLPFARAGRNHAFGTFTAAFEKDGTRAVIWGPQPHSFQFGRLRPGEEEAQRPAHEEFLRAIPVSGWDEEVLTTARIWMKNCVEGHDECRPQAGARGDFLPPRLIDVGEADSGNTRLVMTSQLPHSEQPGSTPYAALSHCWGGDIPFRLTMQTLPEKCETMPLNLMPRNFRDAIHITRKLGIRYLWIDALCIIQDSTTDWASEAAHMLSCYAGATLTISALDSPSSESGIIPAHRGARAVLPSGTFAIQRIPDTFSDIMAKCHLSHRGWCLQERLMAPRILHIANSQIYWECHRGFEQENAAYHSKTQVDAFTSVRQRYASGMGDGDVWSNWYHIVEEFTSRELTYASDTFPALAGVAELFRRSSSEPRTYAAGLWVEDIREGLLWGARKVVERMRKAPGFRQCAVLHRRDEPRAPTWSWASVAGPVQFDYKSGGTETCDILGVTLKSGINDPMANGALEGVVRIRGLVAQMRYMPPDYASSNVGKLAFRDADAKPVFLSCVMDFDRMESRVCFALLVRWSVADGNIMATSLLVLDRLPGEKARFRRIGVCQSSDTGRDMIERVKRFSDMEIEIV
ncbi:heterokaryon incompatibility protein-domain-containing protein [Xylariaceae sp. FL1272]|nr:heterokaryon incompatibility protein-domain-containing protein [Xylariaceae sp. FL1272]